MTNSIRIASKNYVPKTAKNITELKSVDVDAALLLETGTNAETQEPYEYNYIEVNGEKYRVPDSVLSNLKAILEKKPSLKTFCVSKSGEGRLTKYSVIPLD
ncbi:MAG TPA: hypothetical protein V6C58_04650 [Allocoleopsis sp.]